MKTRIILFLLLSGLLATAQNIRLLWDYTNSTTLPDVFKLYHSIDLALPLTNWSYMTNTSGTNLSLVLQIPPGQHFFYLTASNFWGEGPPSNVASTPPLPTNATLRIERIIR